MATAREFPRWVSLLFIAVGLYIALGSLGIVAPLEGTAESYSLQSLHWQDWHVTSLGVAFICAGIASAFRNTRNRLVQVNAVVLVASFLVPMVSLVYFYNDSVLLKVWLSFILFISVAISLAWYMPSKKKPPVVASGEDPVGDPLYDAEVHLSWGRTEQAEAILEKAMQRYPSRTAEFQRKLRIIRQDTQRT